MANNKVKKKLATDVRLKVFRNLRKTFKYYFKNIFYIIFLNVSLILLCDKFFKTTYLTFLSETFQKNTTFNLFYYVLPIIFFTTIKIILYGNTVYVMKSGGINDIKDLFSLVIKRFLPVFGTFIIFVFSVMIFSVFLIIPGIMYFFYYYFAIFLSAIGDINNKENNQIKILNGLKTLGRSYILVRGNLIRFAFLTFVIFFTIFTIERFTTAAMIESGFNIDSNIVQIVRFCIFDIFIIYSVLIFVKFEGIENDIQEERFKRNREEEVMLNRAVVDKFGNSKK